MQPRHTQGHPTLGPLSGNWLVGLIAVLAIAANLAVQWLVLRSPQ
jgi:hypothetical protein